MVAPPAYDVRPHELPGFPEKTRSRLPALHLLMKMGWTYLTPGEVDRLRGGRLDSAVLEPVLVEHLSKHCRFTYKGTGRPFTENAIQSAVQTLKSFRPTGTGHQSEQAYDLLCLGISVPQTVEGDTKSFIIDYIDWKNPANNTYHCTTEYKVEGADHQKDAGPHIVLFVNGITLVVMACEMSACPRTRRRPVDRGIDQLAVYQKRDGIPRLFLFSQLLLALAGDTARYGTTGTPHQYWTVWKESGVDGPLKQVMDAPVSDAAMDRLLSGPFADVRGTYQTLLAQGRGICEQDRLLYALCRPERLLELTYKFILFDAGAKKIARYQQYFTVQEILKRVLSAEEERPRPGGVVWHAQGSGKSLTMVMLAKSLALHPAVINSKIILVTDRIDLDDQIYSTFRACGLAPERAATGKHLVSLLADRRTQVMTTLIHKFAAAAAYRDVKQADRNTFVLVDEGHRSQYNEQHARMRVALKGACFIAFTGTPLAKSVQKNTFARFGDLFHPAYTISRAVQDKAVVPLLYEARHIPQAVNRRELDRWFDVLASGLTREQRAQVKHKFSSERQLNKSLQKVRMIAWDVSLHYASACQGTGLKGQLVAPDKETALQYKAFLDEFGLVDSDVLISAPAAPEGEDRSNGPTSIEETFWQEMMARFGTGFDAPCNTVLYLARKLKEHTLLQAVARVNRLYPGKTFGLIMDYSGVIRNLDHAIDFYDQLSGYDPADVEATVAYVCQRTDQLPLLHADLRGLFDTVKDTAGQEVYEIHLRDKALRNRFHEYFKRFAGTLALALSSTAFLTDTPETSIRRYKDELKFFQRIRVAVSQRYQETVDNDACELRIRRLIDTQIGAGEAQRLCKPINLLDAGQREKVLADAGKSAGTKVDMLAAATRYVIEQEMVKDPAFYKKFSKLLQEVIDAYHTGRVKDLEALARVQNISTKVTTHTDDDIPQEIMGQDMARRYYGCVTESLPAYGGRIDSDHRARIAMLINERLAKHKIRDWRTNPDVINRMRGEIDDILFDMAESTGIALSLEDQDDIIERCMDVTMANED
jgi:type I restriction enzyme R subunit